MTFPDRVADRAVEVRPVRVVLTVLAAPLYVLGFVVGLVIVCVVWMWAAAAIGFSDARGRNNGEQ